MVEQNKDNEEIQMNQEEAGSGSSKQGKRKKKTVKERVIIGMFVLDALLVLYFVAVFSNIPFVAKWRRLYIETAMSTTSHQWLATAFIPKSIIDQVLEERNYEVALQKLMDSNWDTNADGTRDIDDAKDFYELYWELDTDSVKDYFKQHDELLSSGYDSILIEDLEGNLGLKTVQGDSLLVLDTRNNLFIVGVKGDGYQGKMAAIKNPAQIILDKSDALGSYGQIVDKFGEKNDALLAINASGFKDVEGHGSGGEVRGSVVIDGVDYGDHTSGKSHWKFIGFQEDNRLYVTNYDKSIIKDYKWAVEFSPALIVNGEIVAEGSYGWGIQPRTVIGQAQDGTFMMLVVDGRQPGYSVGCTVGECAIILDRYQADQAVNLDGGSSSVMWDKDRQITKSSSPSGYGRYLPDAVVVKKTADIKKDSTDTND